MSPAGCFTGVAASGTLDVRQITDSIQHVMTGGQTGPHSADGRGGISAVALLSFLREHYKVCRNTEEIRLHFNSI